MKAAAKTATNAPVASWWALATARLDADVVPDPEVAAAAPEPEPEPEPDLVAVSDVAIVEELAAVELAAEPVEVLASEARALVVEFKEPHFSFMIQVFWPARSLG